MAKKTKRFWVGSPDGYGQPDEDQVEGCLMPDDDGMVYPRKPDTKPRRAERGTSKGKKRPRKP
jgi:hypothetical protein